MNMQTLEQTIAQKARCRIQALSGLFGIARQDTEIDLGVRVIGRDLNRIDRDHAHTRVFQLACNQLGQITLDLVGDAKPAIGNGRWLLARHLQCSRDFLDVEEFELIAFFDVVVVLELDTALEAFL